MTWLSVWLPHASTERQTCSKLSTEQSQAELRHDLCR